MDIKRIRAIVDLVKESGIAELEINEGENRLKISAFGKNINSEMFNQSSSTHMIQPENIGCGLQNSNANNQNNIETIVTPDVVDVKYIKSPMVGTFYSSPSPGKPSFIEIGQQVKVGQVLCIIEAMKLMNRIEAEHEVLIKEILVSDGAPVEFGQNLFIVE